MKTTKKLTLNKETIAHLSRTELRTVVGGYAIKPNPTTPDVTCNGGTGTCAGATCVATCLAKTCGCGSATCGATRVTYCQQATCVCATGGC